MTPKCLWATGPRWSRLKRADLTEVFLADAELEPIRIVNCPAQNEVAADYTG
jgi:hypothetical protein